MKTTIFTFLLLVTTICQATYVNLTWSNSTTPSYGPSGENMQSSSYGWVVEVVEYDRQYALATYGNVLATGTIGPDSSAPFRSYNVLVDIPEGTKVYLRVYNATTKSMSYCYANLAPETGQQYYTVKSYEDSINLESISEGVTLNASKHGVWADICATYLTYNIYKVSHSNGDIVCGNNSNISPILNGTITNGWEIALLSSIYLYPVEADGYAFYGWTDSVSGRHSTPLVLNEYWRGASIGANFTTIPTNFYVTSEFVSGATNLELVINFDSKEAFNYHVEYTDILASNAIWQTCSTNMTATGSNTVWSLCVDPSITSRYYRVIQENP
jgi:hypothetical protein